MRGKDRYKKTKWVRICPCCKKEVYHKNFLSLRTGIYCKNPCWECRLINQKEQFAGNKNPMFGKTHSIEVKNKLKFINTGKKLSPKTIERMKKSLKNVIHTEKWSNNISNAVKGNKNHFYGKRHTKETKNKIKNKLQKLHSGKNNPFYGKTHNSNTKEKLRINCLERIKLTGKFPGFNKTACKFFNILNEKLKWNGQYALNNGEKELIGYSIDYFEPTLNLIIEWDEERHYGLNEELHDKDVIRQQNILKGGNYHFYRIREKTKDVCKIDNLPINYTESIQELLNEFKK